MKEIFYAINIDTQKKGFFMKKFGIIFVITAICFAPLHSQEKNYQARAAASSSTDASALSIGIWGVGIALGIAAIFLLLKSSEGTTTPVH
jgi:hypothetical protein